MKRKLVNIFICFVMFFCTCIIVFAIYKKSTKISYPWYFEKLKISDNQHYGKQEDIGIAIIDSGFNENCQKYFDKEIIKYDATGENNTSDLTGHGTQMALLIGSNSKKRNQFMELILTYSYILLEYVIRMVLHHLLICIMP